MSDFKKYIKAVRELYPNALVTRQNSETGEYTSEDIDGNVVEVNINAIQNKITEMDNAIEVEIINKANKKASGKQKLLDLGLSEEEVKALIGV